MFTGIIQDVGTVAAIVKSGDWLLTIQSHHLPLENVSIGASICCSGACMTVIAKTTNTFQIQASQESLGKTTMKDWQIGTRINLEPALRMGEELGGHLVTGHIDSVARVTSRQNVGDSVRLTFDAPQNLRRFIAPKGSVTIDGVSLTVNEVEASHFGVNIIPHTQAATTLGALNVGDTVNVEVDMIARYLDRLIAQ